MEHMLDMCPLALPQIGSIIVLSTKAKYDEWLVAASLTLSSFFLAFSTYIPYKTL